MRWKQFHSSDPSPLIHALLESNLLQIAGQDGQVQFTHSLVYDFFTSLDHVKDLHSTNPTPPNGQVFSNWLYWMVVQWLECANPRNAGLVMWYAGGTLPGYRSGTWKQLAELLILIPQSAQADLSFKIFGEIVQDVNNLDGEDNYGYTNWNGQYNSYSRPHLPQHDSPQDERDLLSQGHKDGLYHYLNTAHGDPALTLGIALGYDQASRNDLWCRKHAWSNLRDRNPEENVEIGWMPFIFRQQTLQEVTFDYARKESNWDLKLSAVELLAAWGIHETISLIAENKIIDLPTEYYHRAKILRCALEGKKGYQEWV